MSPSGSVMDRVAIQGNPLPSDVLHVTHDTDTTYSSNVNDTRGDKRFSFSPEHHTRAVFMLTVRVTIEITHSFSTKANRLTHTDNCFTAHLEWI